MMIIEGSAHRGCPLWPFLFVHGLRHHLRAGPAELSHYPNYPGRAAGRGGYQDAAYSRGYDDGYRRGLEAARDGDRYDVRREGWYRSGDRGYNRRYGSRNGGGRSIATASRRLRRATARAVPRQRPISQTVVQRSADSVARLLSGDAVTRDKSPRSVGAQPCYTGNRRNF